MTVRIITDSGSDISQDEAARMGIVVLPLSTIFPNATYRDGIDLSNEEFFDRLIESDELPTTSQVTPLAWAEAFDRSTSMGEEVLCITLSAKLSGCHQSAQIALEGREAERIFVVDSENVTLGQRLLIEHAVMLRDRGLTAAEIAHELEAMKGKVRVIALLDTLEYLKKGGRISAAVAMAGSLLSIKPVIAIVEGEVALLGKARGSKNGNNLLVKQVRNGQGIDFALPYCLAYSGNSDALLRKYLKDSAALYEGRNPELIPVHTIGSTIGTHVGPGAIALAYFER